MEPIEPASAVVVRVPVPPALGRLRRRWDWGAGVGIPSHVTILFPFLPATRLDPGVRRTLCAIAAARQPFEVGFSRVGRFPGVVYLAPEPAEPFVQLTTALVERFPGHPPYGGRFEEVIPHLTITESEAAPWDSIVDRATRALPFRHKVEALEVLIEGGDGQWNRRWRIPLGVRPLSVRGARPRRRAGDR